MLYGRLKNSDNYCDLLVHDPWREAFTWLDRDLKDLADGEVIPLRGEDMVVRVMKYATVSPEQSRFEAHRRYIDLQVTIAGCEWIEVAPAPTLALDGDYDAETDVQFYKAGPSLGRVCMQPGYYSIYYPSDAHRPKIQDPASSDVFKLVIKIGINLF